MTLAADQKTYKTSSINNRRYLGNKHKLLPFITGVVEKECRDIQSVADIFAGTGAVASAFPDKRIITNDIMYSNYICNLAWFGSETYDAQNVIEAIEDESHPFLLGVQWHPECMYLSSRKMSRIFSSFLEAC